MNDLTNKLDEMLLRSQAEVADNDLYAPIPLKDDCPVCFHPLPIRNDESCYMYCCGKILCLGCIHSSRANGLKDVCAFCRQHFARDDDTANTRLKNRMKHQDPRAFFQMAQQYLIGEVGVEQHAQKALDLLIKAAELGSVEAYAIIAEAYGIIAAKYQMEMGMGKTRRLLEVSAKKGFYVAHEYLGNIETEDGRVGNAIKHWAVAASAGSQYSLDKLMEAYRNSQFSKEGLGQVLRAFQSSNDEMKSKARCDYRRAKSEGRVNLSQGRTSSVLASFSSIKRQDKK